MGLLQVHGLVQSKSKFLLSSSNLQRMFPDFPWPRFISKLPCKTSSTNSLIISTLTVENTERVGESICRFIPSMIEAVLVDESLRHRWEFAFIQSPSETQ
ncbi:hypothetical protein Drorol1_Dr00001510 [Drosera rotundifolia]